MERLTKLVGHFSTPKTCSSQLKSEKTSKEFKTLSKCYPLLYKSLIYIFGKERCSEDINILKSHGRDAIVSPGDSNLLLPQCVVYPISTNEVSSLVKLCNNHKPPIALIAYGSGTSLESHIRPIKGGITISFAKMNKVLKIYPKDLQCTLQCGVQLNILNEKILKKYNLFLGTDPAPAACIGGMISTCCSGPSSFEFGTMLNQIINLTIVLANGNVIKTGQRSPKSVAGYNLNGLFCGSEGTLGIITEATVKLRVIPAYTEIAQALFDNISKVGECMNDILLSGIKLSAFEFLDNSMVNACNKYNPKNKLVNNKHLIIFKFCGPTKSHVNSDINFIKKLVSKYTLYPFVFSRNKKEREKLWQIRKACFWAAKFLDTSREIIVTDVAVPFSHFSQILIKSKNEIDNSIIQAPIVGHIGDGNFHTCLLYDKNSIEQTKEAKRIVKFMVDLALKLDGTCTAEHGIGLHKKKYLTKELGNNTYQFMHYLKDCIDSNHILNPGKVVY